MDRIIVAFASEKTRTLVARVLERGGISPTASCTSGAEVIRMVWTLGDAIVICGYKLRDMTAPELAADLQGIGTLLVVSSSANLDFCTGRNLYTLATPASPSELLASLELLQQDRTSARRRSRQAGPEQADGADRLVISRAKEILMHVNHMTEAEAHRFLQKRSMNHGVRLTEAAQSIIEQYQ